MLQEHSPVNFLNKSYSKRCHHPPTVPSCKEDNCPPCFMWVHPSQLKHWCIINTCSMTLSSRLPGRARDIWLSLSKPFWISCTRCRPLRKWCKPFAPVGSTGNIAFTTMTNASTTTCTHALWSSPNWPNAGNPGLPLISQNANQSTTLPNDRIQCTSASQANLTRVGDLIEKFDEWLYKGQTTINRFAFRKKYIKSSNNQKGKAQTTPPRVISHSSKAFKKSQSWWTFASYR